jgi:hypothetical protein
VRAVSKEAIAPRTAAGMRMPPVLDRNLHPRRREGGRRGSVGAACVMPRVYRSAFPRATTDGAPRKGSARDGPC